MVQRTENEWIRLFLANWLNMVHLTIVSFYNSAGAVINNATIALDSKVLLSVVVGNVAICHPADVLHCLVSWTC